MPIVSNEKCKNMFLAAGRHEVSSQLTYLLSAGAAGHFTSSSLGNSSSEVCHYFRAGSLVIAFQENK